MRANTIILSVLIASACMAGCGGRYILTVPEQAGPTGGQVAVIARLQRTEVSVFAPGVDQAPRFRLAGSDQIERAGYTDKAGYAGTVLQAPDRPGRYELIVQLQDREGDQAAGSSAIYSIDAAAPAVAVDLDSLPWDRDAQAGAVAALNELAARAQLIYLTRRKISYQAGLHAQLDSLGYPDGPILTWTRQRWHIERNGRFNMPKVVIESQLISQLPSLREALPKLAVGVCDSSLAARAFAAVGMRPIMIGDSDADIPDLTSCETWADLGRQGI